MSYKRAAADPDLPSGGCPVRASLVVGKRNKKRLIHNQCCLGAAFVSTWLNKQIFAVETKSPRGWHTQGDFGDHTAYTSLEIPDLPRNLVPKVGELVVQSASSN